MGRISTRKRGNKKISWYYSFEASEGGKRKRIEKGGFATEKEALEAGTIAQARYLRGDISITSEKVRIQDHFRGKAADLSQLRSRLHIQRTKDQDQPSQDPR